MAIEAKDRARKGIGVPDNLRVGQPVDMETVMAVTGKDPEDLSEYPMIMQPDISFCQNASGDALLYETFVRKMRTTSWIYKGLCEAGKTVNRDPGEASRVFICSPYGADKEWGTRFAKAACRDLFEHGYIPVAPHLYFPQFLDDDSQFEREFGIEAGHEMMRTCDEIFVYLIDSTLSEGMQSDIDFAINELAMQPTLKKMSKLGAKVYIERYSGK